MCVQNEKPASLGCSQLVFWLAPFLRASPVWERSQASQRIPVDLLRRRESAAQAAVVHSSFRKGVTFSVSSARSQLSYGLGRHLLLEGPCKSGCIPCTRFTKKRRSATHSSQRDQCHESTHTEKKGNDSHRSSTSFSPVIRFRQQAISIPDCRSKWRPPGCAFLSLSSKNIVMLKGTANASTVEITGRWADPTLEDTRPLLAMISWLNLVERHKSGTPGMHFDTRKPSSNAKTNVRRLSVHTRCRIP